MDDAASPGVGAEPVFDASLVIVNYNGGEDVVRCLASIDERPAEVVLVDNASEDGSADAVERNFGWVRVVRNVRNEGFARAANRGVRLTQAPFIVLLNPDATPGPRFVRILRDFLATHPRAGAVGALVRNPDGSVQPTKRAFPSLWQAALHATVGTVWPDNPGTRAYVLAGESFSVARQVDWVAATAIALRREAFEAIGGFDERFFFFVEDVDLCRRLRDASWEVWFEPAAVVVHRWGGSWEGRPVRYLWLHHVNLFRYVRKHRRGAWVVAYPVVALGLGVRFVLLAARWLLFRRSVPAHRRIGGAA